MMWLSSNETLFTKSGGGPAACSFATCYLPTAWKSTNTTNQALSFFSSGQLLNIYQFTTRSHLTQGHTSFLSATWNQCLFSGREYKATPSPTLTLKAHSSWRAHWGVMPTREHPSWKRHSTHQTDTVPQLSNVSQPVTSPTTATWAHEQSSLGGRDEGHSSCQLLGLPLTKAALPCWMANLARTKTNSEPQIWLHLL